MTFFKKHVTLQQQSRRHLRCISVDPTGTRMLTGSACGTLCLWDFSALKHSLTPLRTLIPVEGQGIRQVLWLKDTGGFIVLNEGITNSIQVFTKTCQRIGEMARGDQYILDQRKTKGHTREIMGIGLMENDTLISWGADGTVRKFPIPSPSEEPTAPIPCKEVLCLKRGLEITDLVIMNGLFLLTCSDESVKAFKTKGPWTGTPIWQLNVKTVRLFVWNNFLIAITDQEIILFENRKIMTRTAVDSFRDATLLNDQLILVTGDSCHSFSLPDLKLSSTQEFQADLIATVPKHTQLCLGHQNEIHLLYGEELKKPAGILLADPSAKRTSTESGFIPHGEILCPNEEYEQADLSSSLHAYRLNRAKQERHSNKPVPPLVGYGHGGRIGTSITQQIMAKHVAGRKDTYLDEDPRKALLRFADAEPKYVGPAYKETQPDPVLDQTLLEQEAEEQAKRIKLTEEEESQVKKAMRLRSKLTLFQ